MEVTFNQKSEMMSGNPVLKKKSISKVLQITEKFDLIHIWRVRNSSSTHFTFRKSYFSGFIQRRLDYIFMSNSVQQSVQNIDILPSFAVIIHHYCCYKKLPHLNLHKNLTGKFNFLLIHNEPYVLKVKKHIENIINLFDPNFNHQMKWEFLKYEICKFTISSSKSKTKYMQEKKLDLEKKNN